MHNVYDELQLVVSMLHKIAFHFFGKVFAYIWIIWIILLLKHIHVTKVLHHVILSRPAGCILNLAKKHGITLIPVHI